MMSFNSFERYQWIPTPDGKLILVDTWTSRVVENAPIYETTTTTTTDTTQVSPEDYDNLSTEESKRRMKMTRETK